MITYEQGELIKFLRGVGYGYAKFAVSVEKQGYCTEKQHQAMIKMKNDIASNRAIIASKKRLSRKYSSGDGLGGAGCSDSEAMSFGEYF